MKNFKSFGFIFILVTIILATTVVSFAESEINIVINENKVTFTDDSGFPFVDDNSRTQVPFRATLESFGAVVEWDSEKQMPYAVYNGIKVYAPIGEEYILVDGVQVPNDTIAILKNDRTYCPIRKVVEAFGFNVGWDSNTSSVVINSDTPISNPSLPSQDSATANQVPHPTLQSQYSVSEGSGKYAGYKILHGHPREGNYVVYFNITDNGSSTSKFISYDILNDEDFNEKFNWTYKGVTYTNTRGELYSYFSDCSSLMSYLDSYSQGEFNQAWFRNTFGQVYIDWLDRQIDSDYAEKQVDAYLEGRNAPNPINFAVDYDDWVSVSNLEEEYELSLERPSMLVNYPHLVWNYNKFFNTYVYKLSGYYEFSNGFLEFNKIRMISNSEGEIFVYRKDIEDHVMAWINEKNSNILSLSDEWLSTDELLEDYGLGFSSGESSIYKSQIGFYEDKGSHDIFFKLDNFTLDFEGEKVFNGIRVTKDEGGAIYFYQEDFNKVVISFLYEMYEEVDAFDSQWIAEYDLSELDIELVKEYIKEGEVYLEEYKLKGNGKEMFLDGLKNETYEDKINYEKSFSGVKVYFKEEGRSKNLFFDREDLIEKGLCKK